MNKYAKFLLEERLKEFCLFQINKIDEYDLEIVAPYKQMPMDERIELTKISQVDFLNGLIDGTAQAKLHENLKKWENNELEISNDQLGEAELDAFINVQKQAMVKFVAEFSSDPIEIGNLCQKIVEYYGVIERESYKTYARIKNNALNEIKNLSLQLKIKNEEINSSLRYARKIQEVLMPYHKEHDEYIDSFILNKPKDIVSGDFYWLYEKDGFKYYCVGDCTGHGVPGALLTTIALGLLQRAVNEVNLSKPSEILNFLHDEFKKRFKKEEKFSEGLDITLCRICSKTNEILFSAAGHILFVVNDKNEIEMHKSSRKSIGSSVFTEKYEDSQLDYEKCKLLYMQSDGYSDQIGEESNKCLKRKGYLSLLNTIKVLPINQQLVEMDKFIQDWQGSIDQLDDICVMGLKLN